MDTVELLKPILEGGIRSINFFNGRLLSGEDLTQEQDAQHKNHLRLGQAIGAGIACGLEVAHEPGLSTSARHVVIKPGLAINRNGQTLALGSTVKAEIIPASGNGSSSTRTNSFEDCKPLQAGTYVAGEGIYILTIGPASGTEELAPTSGLGKVTVDCNARYKTEGIKLRLIQLNLTNEEFKDTSRLRNQVAYKCFGIDDQIKFRADILGKPLENYGLVDERRPKCLTNDEVPLAVLYLTTKGIQFVDMWSVRRRLTRPANPAATDPWNAMLGDRRRSEAEAMLLQFQEQIDFIRDNETNLESIVATDLFDYLPPVGILPLAGVKKSQGFVPEKFFQNLTVRKMFRVDSVEWFKNGLFIEGSKLEVLIRKGLTFPPVKLSSKEMLWLYVVRENAQAIKETFVKWPQAYMIFASGFIPFQGHAQYDLSKWEYSNYSSLITR